jgi:hypothetical protein
VKPATNAAPDQKAMMEHVLVLLRKDVGAALAMAEDLGVEVPGARLTYETGADILGLGK